ncbi:MAG: alpha/beta fold hydrolase [Mariprofundaceae bacterium]|nr:alpha/beta fold hydrolase [Mariprofundaceae bacterium]
MNYLLRLMLFLTLAMVGSVAYMTSHEADYIYFPDREMSQSPRAIGLGFSVQRFKTPDDIELYGWYMPQQQARFVVLSLHGNAGNISHRLDQYQRWHKMGLSVFAFDYRGFGDSDGQPSEDGLYTDAKTAWTLLTDTFGIAPARIIIAGRSLGSPVAARLAAGVSPAGVVLEVPFTSMPDMSADQYPWLPLRWFVKSQFDTRKALSGMNIPLLLISASEDELIPQWMPEQLFEAYKGNKLRGALAGGHNDFDSISEGAYLRLWEIWLDSLTPPEEEPLQWVYAGKRDT